ncbi:aminoglycoside phosphotransferase family protein [Bacillus sp. RO1]|uniref:phosphotransferase family protein n=1 Tax=Bacillus sp. RO1 TaxID=2722703 RepID=UPI0014569638|nr:aminoglycoside phosphotransferase family protein [Bacillus sp. RO1]NLP50062.1 aminoglycoside phosphotransferase family protein [Bacillus sp. RO1]
MKPIHLEEIPSVIQEYVRNIHSITFPRQGYTSDVGIIQSENGQYALKRTKEPQFNTWLKKEIIVLKSLNQKTSLPVPKVEKFIEVAGQSWALLEYLEGETLRAALTKTHSKVEREALLINFGKVVSDIHATPCPEGLKNEKTWLDDMLDQAAYNLHNYEVDGSEDLLEQIKENRPNKMKQTLIHGDLTVDNILVHNGVVTGIIDWSGGAYGDPRYDVSLAIRPKPHIFEWESDKLCFLEGYGCSNILTKGEYDYFINLYEYF